MGSEENPLAVGESEEEGFIFKDREDMLLDQVVVGKIAKSVLKVPPYKLITVTQPREGSSVKLANAIIGV